MEPSPFRSFSSAPTVSGLPAGERGPGLAEADIRIALVGTFTPRKCGIATFTSDVHEQLARFHSEIGVEVFALDRSDSDLVYDGVEHVIAVDRRESFADAARALNRSTIDAVWIQHEFGIFGENDGEAVCDFVDQIAAPLVFTFHTVLTSPSPRQFAIMRHLISRASRIMVMSQHGRDLLAETYGAPAGAIEIIDHGAPDRPFGRSDEFKEWLGLSGRKVLMTFGLLGPGKGLERVIEALPAIVARHPDTVYRIVGATHPNLVAAQGEAYREELQALAAKLGVERHIEWENRFLDTPELLDQLEACDIYVVPYSNLQQSTSGTLSYAVALGKAVVSTPYVHARELLGNGVGVLVGPDSHQGLSAAIVDLLDDKPKLGSIQRKAYMRGRSTIWPEFARASAGLVRRAAAAPRTEIPFTSIPGLSALFEMSDATGMLQHAIGAVPDRDHGYCLDDNARALMLVNVAGGLSSAERKSRSLVYASFIQHAWNEDAARFRNFMRFDRTWCEDAGSEDSNGRALWALGHTAHFSRDPDLRWWAMHWFERTGSALSQLTSPRAVAFAMLGATGMLRATRSHAPSESILASGGDLLHRLLACTRRPDWAWFEAVLGYDNPRLAQALIEAGDLLDEPVWIASGLETLEWIAARQTAACGRFRPIGSQSFGRGIGAHLPFDQQPVEAQAAVEAAETAHRISRDSAWADHARAAYAWFFGANDRRVELADLASGRCRDGVTPRGRNENCGAESILAFQLAHYALQRLHRGEQAQAPSAFRFPRIVDSDAPYITEPAA